MADQIKKLLIIEDDELITQMYKASLAQSKFEVKWESDGETGWNTLQTYTPDLVILDIMLPKFSGLEILAKIKADPRLKNIPVIILSSLADDGDKQKALSMGAKAYWVKNEVNMVDFETMINKAIA